MPWAAVLATLAESGYAGGISIELEDEQYLGDEAAERRGLAEAAAFLAGRPLAERRSP